MQDEANPYQPPSHPLPGKDGFEDAVLASKWRRFGTLVIDYICYIVLGGIFGFLVALLFGDKGIAMMERIPEYLLGLVIIMAFYLFFEGIWGRTPGKFVMGTIVQNEEGQKMSAGQLLKRTMCRFIPFEPFSFFGKTGWHDSISDTRVVMRRK